MALRKVQSAAIADNAITSAKIASGTIVSPSELTTEVNNLIAGAPGALNTLDELAAALGDDANFATTVTNTLSTKAGITNSTGAIIIPSGTTAQRPASPSVGYVRYNTTLNALENYTTDGWLKVSIPIPVVSSISGTIYNGATTTLTMTGTQFGVSSGTVRFTSGATTKDVAVTPATQTSLTVAVPSEIYSLATSSVVSIKFINGDGGQSNLIDKTVTALPTGGTITTYGSYRVHTFTTSGTFVTSAPITADILLVAGGGGGGGGRSSGSWGGGGGAGGVIVSTGASLSSNSYGVTIGAGSGVGTQGSNSTFNGLTAIGGGYGGNGDATSVPTSWSIGGNGGSGGGGQGDTASAGGSGTAGQGYAGGTGQDPSPEHAGGGGGASQVGYNGTGDISGSSTSGRGGDGIANSFRTGSSVYYAGGGGGGWGTSAQQSSLTALGGGGRGGSGYQSSLSATAGGANTGGGGGGGYNPQSGGSGILVIRYTL